MDELDCINSVLTGLLAYYLLLSLFYCLKRDQKVFVFWMDYVVFICVMISLNVYLICSLCSTNNKSSNVDDDWSLTSKLVVDFSISSSLLIMNSINGICFIIGVNRLMTIPKHLKDSAEQSIYYFSKNGITKYISKFHYIFLAIVVLVQALLIFFYIQYPIKEGSIPLYVHVSLLGVDMLIVFIVKNRYSKLVNYRYYSNNLLIENQFIKSKNQALLLIEHLIIKNIFDIMISIPLYFTLVLSGREQIILLCNTIGYVIYAIFYGSLLLTIDQRNKVVLPVMINCFYFFPLFSYNVISSKETVLLYNEHLNASLDDNNYKNTRPSSFAIDTFNQEREHEAYKTEKEFLPCNFFLIFKLLYLYFKKNEKVYLETEKLVEEDGIPFRNFLRKETKPLLTSSNISDQISKISRISMTNREKIHPSAKFPMNAIMNSMDEKPLKDEFIKYILNDVSDNRLNDPVFIIEALFMDVLFELFPFYQISINDVMRSLDIAENKELFKFFFETKSQKKHFNSFYTKDLFLSFEVYDQNFLQFDTIKKFITSYKVYLLDKMKSFSFTFLPMIIGVFNVTYLSYSKIVVLYKNPIAFSSVIKFNCWINYCYSDPNTSIQKSTKESDIADLEEIEVKNNIYLAEEDYNEAIKTLKGDLKFLKSHCFDLNFFLNLFVLNDAQKNYNDHKMDIMLFNKDSQSIVDKKGNDELINAMRDSNFLNDSIDSMAKQLKKYYGSDIVSLIEKLYENTVAKNKYVFKIYFSEVFRSQTKVINKEVAHEVIDIHNKQYCKT